MENSQTAGKPESAQPELAIQRIYVKDISLESPHSPEIFRESWQPELKLELNVGNQTLAADVYEIVINLTATVNCGEKVAFLIELKHAGIFTLRHFNPQQLEFALGCIAPSILFPYTREVISDLSVRAGFPPLLLAPVNFEAVFAQQKARANQKQPEVSLEQNHLNG